MTQTALELGDHQTEQLSWVGQKVPERCCRKRRTRDSLTTTRCDTCRRGYSHNPNLNQRKK